MTDRTDDDWLTLLVARDAAAVADLCTLLTRGLMKTLSGRGATALAEDFAQEAALKVLDRLPQFRRESRFSTWALAVATRVAFSELRKARHRDVSLEQVPAAADVPAAAPPDAEPLHAVLKVLRHLIATDLTEKQRTLVLGELAGVPQVVLADRLGATINAIYKLGHDARMRLKRGLDVAGFPEAEVRSALAAASH